MTDYEELPEGEPQPIIRPVAADSTDHTLIRQGQALSGSSPAIQVLGACLIDGDNGQTLQSVRRAGITADHFRDRPDLAAVYLSLCRLQDSQAPVSVESLAADLTERKMFEQVGGWGTVFSLTVVPTTAFVSHYIAALKRRKLTADLQRAAMLIADRSADDPQTVIQEITSMLREDATSRPWQSSRIRAGAPPPEPQTRLFLAGKPICTPGNLTTIIARAKTGKTTALGAATAAIIAAHYDRTHTDTLRFSAPHNSGHAVILIDTEQSQYDAWACHLRTLARADSPDPQWLYHYSLVGSTAADLRQALPQILATAKEQTGGVFTVILDGVADFVTSVNDEPECNAFVAHLHALAAQYDTPILCVIHSNEAKLSGDDGRGHLGKQLTRKAESNLLLKKTDDVTTITSEKQRKAPITEADGVAFRWDDTLLRHTLTDAPKVGGSATPKGRPSKYAIADFMQFIPFGADKAMPAAQIHRRVAGASGISLAGFKDLLFRSAQSGAIFMIDKPGVGLVFHA